ncbi:MAG: hypothetical protein WD646_00300 [Actinomycetota bacterium]
MMPLYEAKMIHHYDTRWATYKPDGSTRPMTEVEKAAHKVPLPRYWVPEREIDKKLDGKWDKPWFLGWRDVARSTDERTFITALLPRTAINHKVLLALPTRGRREDLQGALTSFVYDYVARQKIGGTSMGYFTVNQLPVPTPEDRLAHLDLEWLGTRVDRLNGWISDADERARVRAEIDAYFFHLYGLTREDVEYVMDTFPIIKRKDEERYGEYRTTRLILDAYDTLAREWVA